MRTTGCKSCQRGGVGTFLLGIIFCLMALYYFGSRHGSNPSSPPGASVNPIAFLVNASPSSLRPDGELAELFSFGSNSTDLQRQLKLKEIIGKVVEWRLPVYEVRQSGNEYLIQTSAAPLGDIFSAISASRMVQTFLHVTPRDDSDRRLIESLKTGSFVTVKGVIEDSTMRNLDIRPAILVRETPSNAPSPSVELNKGLPYTSTAGQDTRLATGAETSAEQGERATLVNESRTSAILDEVYGQFDHQKGCWIKREKEGADGYCMTISRIQRVTTSTGIRYYLLTLGHSVDANGKPDGSRNTPGTVDVFVIETGSGLTKIGTSSSFSLGTFGGPPDGWKFVKLGHPDLWGWQSEYTTCSQGYCSGRHIILASNGSEFIDLASNLVSSFGDPSSSTSINTKIEIDYSQKVAKVFPLVLTVTGESGGKKVTPRVLKVPFDEKSRKYVAPMPYLQ